MKRYGLVSMAGVLLTLAQAAGLGVVGAVTVPPLGCPSHETLGARLDGGRAADAGGVRCVRPGARAGQEARAELGGRASGGETVARPERRDRRGLLARRGL